MEKHGVGGKILIGPIRMKIGLSHSESKSHPRRRTTISRFDHQAAPSQFEIQIMQLHNLPDSHSVNCYGRHSSSAYHLHVAHWTKHPFDSESLDIVKVNHTSQTHAQHRSWIREQADTHTRTLSQIGQVIEKRRNKNQK